MMIYGDVALFVNSLFLSAMTFFVALFFLLPLKELIIDRLQTYSARTRQAMLWLIVTAPWIVSAISFSILMSFPATPASPGPLHFHHNAYEYAVFTWHTLVPLAFLVIATRSIFRYVLKAFEHARAVHELTRFSSVDNTSSIDVEKPHVFTLGLFRPRIYFTEGLLNKLTADEYKTIHAHEKAHQVRKDPLKKFVFSFMSTFFPSSFSKFLCREMMLAIEQAADEYAAEKMGDNFLVAQTLVSVEKIKRQSDFYKVAGQQCAFDDADIQRRVSYLIDEKSYHPFPVLPILAISIAVVLLNFISTDIFHHFAEVIFHH